MLKILRVELKFVLDTNFNWSNKWQTNFNTKNCNVFNADKSSKDFKLDNRKWLQSVDKEKQLSVFLNSNSNFLNGGNKRTGSINQLRRNTRHVKIRLGK